MKRIIAVFPLLVVLFFSAGCPSFSTMGTARTLPKSSFQVFVAPEVVVARDWAIGSEEVEGTVTWAQFELGARYGITDSVELDAKLWELGFELGTKIQLYRSDSEDSGIDVAIEPGAGYLTYGASAGESDATIGSLSLYLPVLLGVNVGGGSQIVLAPKVVDQIFFGSGSSSTVNALWGGGSLGFAWKLGERFRIMPEVSVVYPLSTSIGNSSDVAFKGMVLQGGIGLLFGG
jgi:hypothetical protein